MAGILVVYYSFEGNTRSIAEAIATAAGADLLELRPERDVGTHGFLKYPWGGRQVVMKSAPTLRPLEKDPGDYRLLFIGTPVWAFSYTPALNTFFTTVPLQGKKVALFCTHGGGPKNTLKKMRDRLAGNEVLGEIDFIEPLNHPEQKGAERAAAWAREIVAKAG